MSAYITLMTPMTDQECLVAAIVDAGITRTDIEISAIPLSLRGWGQDRKANIVLRKTITGDAYNDIGFLCTPTGYTAIISDDHRRFGRKWLANLNDSYQTHLSAKHECLAAEERRKLEEERRLLVEAQRQGVYERAKKMGYQVKETVESDTIRLVLIKRTY
jgi:hypothetical protein